MTDPEGQKSCSPSTRGRSSHTGYDWPQHLVNAFDAGMEGFEAAAGNTKEQAILYMLGAAVRRAVYRCHQRGVGAEYLPTFLQMPYTPLGDLTACGLDGRAARFRLGQKWGDAVEHFYRYAGLHADELWEAFKDHPIEYRGDI